MALMSVPPIFLSFPPKVYLRSGTNSPPGEDILTQPLLSCDRRCYHASVRNFQWGQAGSLLFVYQNMVFSAIKQEKEA